MSGYYKFMTRAGEFRIVPTRDGRWCAMYADDGLGVYNHAWQAAEDLAGGHTFMPSCGDTAKLGIPEEISEWQFVGPR